MVVDKEELIRLQLEDTARQRFEEEQGIETRKEYVISLEKRGEIWYQIRQRKDEKKNTQKQILCSSRLERKRWRWLTVLYLADMSE